MESSKISSSTADLYSWRSLSIVLGQTFTVVPRWLGGIRTGFWIRGWGFKSSSLSIPYGLLLISIEIHGKKLSLLPPFLKSTWQKKTATKIWFQQIKMKKMLLLQYANNIDKTVAYTAILTTKSGWTSLLSILSIVFACYGLQVCINWS